MLINISNHPSEFWSDKQLSYANNLYGYVVDHPFPYVDPQFDSNFLDGMAVGTASIIIESIESSGDENNAVHIMGELVFTYKLVTLLKENGIRVIASTTEREAFEDDEGIKRSRFVFEDFREY